MTAQALPPTQFDLSGKVALVTGASSGIGREIANAPADAGADYVTGQTLSVDGRFSVA